MAAHRYWRFTVTHKDGGSYYTGFTQCSMMTTLGGANACTGGTASASSESSGSYVAANAINGSSSNGWATAPVTSAWWKYDFGSAVDIVQFSVTLTAGEFANYWIGSIVLQSSDDDSTWTDETDVLKPAQAGNAGDLVQTHNTGVFSSKYWRLAITSAASFPAIGSLELRATSGGADQCNGSAGYPEATSSFSGSNTAAEAFDNNGATWWTAGGTAPQTLKFVFPDDRSVEEYMIKLHGVDPANNYPSAWTLDYSGDGYTWTTADTRTGVTTWTTSEEKVYTLAAASADTTGFFLFM